MPETKLTPEEQAAMTEARRASQAMVKRLASPGDNFVVVDDLVLDKDKNERTIMTVPRNFFLVLDDHRRIKFNAGICSVPNELAEHWYVKGHGCKAYTGGGMSFAAQSAAPAMLGSDELPPLIRIGGEKRPIGDFIMAAAASGKLSIADWNALPEDERRDRIVAELDKASREAREAAEKARPATIEQSIDAAKVQIDAAAAPNAPPSPAAPEQTGSGETKPDADKAS